MSHNDWMKTFLSSFLGGVVGNILFGCFIWAFAFMPTSSLATILLAFIPVLIILSLLATSLARIISLKWSNLTGFTLLFISTPVALLLAPRLDRLLNLSILPGSHLQGTIYYILLNTVSGAFTISILSLAGYLFSSLRNR